MHAVVVQVQPRDRGVVADIVGLVRIDRGDARQGPLMHQKPARHPAHAARGQPRHQIAQPVRAQRGIARARQHQIALHQPARDRPRRQHARDPAVPLAQPFHRVKRRHRLGARGRGQGAVLFPPLQQRARRRIHDRQPRGPRQPRLRHQIGQRGPRRPGARLPQGSPRARHRARRPRRCLGQRRCADARGHGAQKPAARKALSVACHGRSIIPPPRRKQHPDLPRGAENRPRRDGNPQPRRKHRVRGLLAPRSRVYSASSAGANEGNRGRCG
jgi:hypothetical protein